MIKKHTTATLFFHQSADGVFPEGRARAGNALAASGVGTDPLKTAFYLSVSYSALQFHARINETIRNIDYEVRTIIRRRRKPWCRKSWCNRNPECSARNTCRGPGYRKRFLTKPPVSTDACRDWAETVTTGMMALRIACLKIMPLWERPFCLSGLDVILTENVQHAGTHQTEIVARARNRKCDNSGECGC